MLIHRFTTHRQRWTVLIAIFMTTAVEALHVIELDWSNTTYGPDGPWYAASVYVGFNGTSGQRFDLYPAGNGATELFLDGYCANDNIPDNQCGAITSGMYNPNISTTAIPYSNPNFTTSLNIDQSVNEQIYGGHIWYDNIYFTNNQPFNSPGGLPNVFAKNDLIIGLTKVQDVYPNGIVTSPQVGLLNLGGLDDAGFQNTTVITSALETSRDISSASYGLHIGSVSMGIPPSMTYGGYDASRIVGEVISLVGPTVSKDYDLYAYQLNDIGIGTAEGASPFPQQNRYGILAQDNSSLAQGMAMSLYPQSPWISLPQSVCTALVQDLPVNYDTGLGLYLWNTSDPRYSQIVSSPSFVAFNMSSPSSNDQQITIKVPFSLLNLTLEPPYLVSEPTPYFPFTPANSSIYYLGRAFLQAAFMGANWRPRTPPGATWLAQAPGPNLPAQNITALVADDVELSNNNVDWASTWSGHWTPLNEAQSNPTNANGDGSSGLSPGARAGLGVGLGLGIPILAGLIFAALYAQKRRKSQQRKEEEASQDKPFSSTSDPDKTIADCKAELAAEEKKRESEKDQLTSDDPAIEMDDALGGAANPAEALYDTQQTIHEMPSRTEYYKGMPVRHAGDLTQRVELDA